MTAEGYDPDIFVDRDKLVEEDLYCPICQCILREPVETRKCGHTFCKLCILTWLDKNNKCPSDNTPLSKTELNQSVRLERRVFMQKVHCTSPQCPWVGPLSELTPHLEKKCELLPVACPHVGCDERPARRDTQAHLGKCPHRPLPCACGKEIPASSMAAHLREFCPSAPQVCDGCKMSVARSEAPQHAQVCPVVIVDCPHKQFGCNQRMVRKDVAAHVGRAEHQVMVLNAIVERQQKQIDILTTNLAATNLRLFSLECDDSYSEPPKDLEKMFHEAEQLYRSMEFDKAIPTLVFLAGRRHTPAMGLLGKCYAEGRGVPKDLLLACKWFARGGVVGETDYLKYFGDLHLLGDSAQGMEEAFDALTFAAASGSVGCMVSLADCYLEARGTTFDLDKARHWLDMARAGGSQKAIKKLEEINDKYKDSGKVESLMTVRDRVEGLIFGLLAGDKNGGPARMGIKLGQSLVDNKGIAFGDLALRYLKWYLGPPFDFDVFIDSGPTFARVVTGTFKAMGTDPPAAGSPAEKDYGERVAKAMRAQAITVDKNADGKTAGANPAHRGVVLAACPTILTNQLHKTCAMEAGLTHANALAALVMSATVHIARHLVLGVPFLEALALTAGVPELVPVKELLQPFPPNAELSKAKLSPGGFAPDALRAAIFFLCTQSNFKNALQASLRFSGQANYSAVIVGALGGARWGRRAVETVFLAHWPFSVRRAAATTARELAAMWRLDTISELSLSSPKQEEQGLVSSPLPSISEQLPSKSPLPSVKAPSTSTSGTVVKPSPAPATSPTKSLK